MGRRSKDEGSIYPIKDAEGRTVRWGASITAGYVDGKRKRKKIERKTRRDVVEELARLKLQQAQGVDLATKQPLVQDFCTEWLDGTFALKARPKSVDTYRQMFIYHIFPAFGQKKVKDVTHRMVQRLVTDMHQRGSADKTIGLARAAGRQVFAAAVRQGLIDRNPFLDLVLPTGTVRLAEALTIEQARAFLDEAKGERLEVALRLMLSLGLRRGEVCGLRWGVDLDLGKGTLTINGNLQYVRGHNLVWGPPKTKSGVRTFKLPARLLAMLVWHRQEQDREKNTMGNLWQGSPYVFTSTTGAPLNSNELYKTFVRIRDRIGLPKSLTPHSLRHSFASFSHAEGMPLKTISASLGHANTRITNDLYVHLFQDELDGAAATIESLLERAAGA